jgi:hypothetical protein
MPGLFVFVLNAALAQNQAANCGFQKQAKGPSLSVVSTPNAEDMIVNPERRDWSPRKAAKSRENKEHSRIQHGPTRNTERRDCLS